MTNTTTVIELCVDNPDLLTRFVESGYEPEHVLNVKENVICKEYYDGARLLLIKSKDRTWLGRGLWKSL
jgi:hypothetical protein